MESRRNNHKTFLDRIKKCDNGCWEWQHSKNERGYGIISFNNVNWKAHRYSYHYYKGDIGGMNVLHKCDNPSCCNPDHLFLGDLSENTLDMIRKGRGRRTNMTIDNVFQIRELANAGTPRKVISEKLGVTIRTIDNIIQGKRWAHLTIENKNSYLDPKQ